MEYEESKIPNAEGVPGDQPAVEPPPPAAGRKKNKIVLMGILTLVVLAGAAAFYFFYLGDPSRQTLATVNGETITVEQFNKELEKAENPLRDMYREEPDKFIEALILKTVLLQESKKEGISVPAKTFKDAGKETLPPEEYLISELMKKKFSAPPEVTQDEIKAFYDLFKGQMQGKPLKEVAPVIEQLIRQGKQQEGVERYVKDLRQAAKVEIDQGRLKKLAAKPPESNTEEEFKKALGSGKPVLVDFGANSCVPCRQMRPVLNELNKQYAGKASVLILDVYRYQGLARDYQIQLIPTLVFFDAKGKEAFRHVGVLDKEKIVSKLRELGMST